MGQIPGGARFNAEAVADDDLLTLITHINRALERKHVDTIIIENKPHKAIHLTRPQAQAMVAALRVRYYEIMN